jgi:hypothetical protein
MIFNEKTKIFSLLNIPFNFDLADGRPRQVERILPIKTVKDINFL